MISRVTYLHVALHEEVMQFSGYAPVAAAFSGMSVAEPPDSPTGSGEGGSGDNSEDNDANRKEASESRPSQPKQPNMQTAAYPEQCWFEDEESGAPLRWHLFVGVLYDLMKGRAMIDGSSWRGVYNEPTQHNFLPWKIRVHFTSYPTDQLLPLEDGTPQPKLENANNNNNEEGRYSRITALVGRIFRNSLKQALFLQYGSSKVAMSINKNSHEKIWDAVLHTNYESYHEVNAELQSGIKNPSMRTQSTANPTGDNDDQGGIPQLIPVRLMLNGMPAIQKQVKHKKDDKDVDCKKRPTELLEELGTHQAPHYTTLGDVLADWLPTHFAVDPSTRCAAPVSDSFLYFSIQGIRP
ncbi:hypothetical protein ACHAXR_007179, partial [Thalassiosira sp. AJA248-18]